MARVDLSEVKPGDSLTDLSLNTTIENWRAATDADGHTGKINELNVRDGGIDQRQFQDSVVHGAVDNVNYFFQFTGVKTPAQSSTTNTWTASEIGPFTHVKDGIGERKYVIRCNMSYSLVSGALTSITPTSDHRWVLHYQIGYNTNTVPYEQRISDTLRRVSIQYKHFGYDNAIGSTGLTFVFEPNEYDIANNNYVNFFIMISQHSTVSADDAKFVINECTFHAQRYDR